MSKPVLFFGGEQRTGASQGARLRPVAIPPSTRLGVTGVYV
jgi:hypothetical protein